MGTLTFHNLFNVINQFIAKWSLTMQKKKKCFIAFIICFPFMEFSNVPTYPLVKLSQNEGKQQQQ